MGKVKITQEQADIVERFKSDFFAFDKEYLIEMIKGHYEIRPNFKAGDIVNDGYGGVREVAEVNEDGMYLYTNYKNTEKAWFGNRTDDYKIMRHATDIEIGVYKERRFWHENGRKFGEYKVNDVLSIRDSKYTWVITDVSGAIDGSTLYRFDNNIETTHKKAELLDRFNVVCFAHDRKDIKHD